MKGVFRHILLALFCLISFNFFGQKNENVRADFLWKTGYEHYKNGDYKLAISVLRPLIDIEESRSLALLGDCFYLGQGVQNNDDSAFFYYQLSAKHKYAYSKYMMAILYSYGHGTKKNGALAEKFYNESLAQLHPHAFKGAREMEGGVKKRKYIV